MIPHDKELYDKALGLQFGDTEFDRLKGLCLTEEGAEAIRSLEKRRYHEEEANAGMI